MTNSQKTKEKANERHGKVELSGDSCCDDSCCGGDIPSVHFESEGTGGMCCQGK